MNVLFIGNAIIDVISHLDEIDQVDPNFIGKMQIVSQKEINDKIKALSNKKIDLGSEFKIEPSHNRLFTSHLCRLFTPLAD